MLSIGAMRGGQQNYYLELAREDYYLAGGEPPGIWHGRGAADLGLAGEVDGEALTRLFDGYHPQQARSLIQQQNYQVGDRQHRPGWDLTFSAPKSVSVLWSQADDATRQKIQQAHFSAVRAALDYLEEEVAITRRGKAGHEKLGARLVIATFEHHTSRAQDPQIHTHALVLNVCTDANGRSGTVESRPLYQAKMAAGAIYRAELALQIEQRLDLLTQRHGNLFEVSGVPQRIIDEFSKRRAEIEAALEVFGHASAAAAATATLNTRANKSHVPQEELRDQWQQIGQRQGWGRAEAHHLLRTSPVPERDHPFEVAMALERAGEQATAHQSYFNRREFTRHLAEECQGRGIGAAELRTMRDTYLAQSAEIVRLGRQKRELVYTTATMMEAERALLGAVARSRDADLLGVTPQVVEGVIATRRQFDGEQAEALRHITEAGGSIRVVSGIAGSGKTTLLHAARLAWELEGFEVHGAALASTAAEGLEQGAGIQSATLQRTLMDLESGRLPLHEKSVLVVDEAGMVGTYMMRQLVEHVEHANARLVLVGERRQIQAIAAGGALAAVEDLVGSAVLQDIKRQRETWARQAVKDVADGETRSGLMAYAERGLVTVAEDRRAAMASLIGDWKEQGVRAPEGQFILAGTRLEAAHLNRMAQRERRQAGLLSEQSVQLPGGQEEIAIGDRVLFTRNAPLYGVRNGYRGEVAELDASRGTLAVRLDKGSLVRFALRDYEHVSLGYAMTTHKAQGATTENAYILAGGPIQDREISYVQLSRARGQTRIYVDAEEAGESLTNLVRAMRHSRQKDLAHTVYRGAPENFSPNQASGHVSEPSHPTHHKSPNEQARTWQTDLTPEL